MIVTVSGAVVVGGVRYTAQTEIDVPDPVKMPATEKETENGLCTRLPVGARYSRRFGYLTGQPQGM
jgi:hypothetical protein